MAKAKTAGKASKPKTAPKSTEKPKAKTVAKPKSAAKSPKKSTAKTRGMKKRLENNPRNTIAEKTAWRVQNRLSAIPWLFVGFLALLACVFFFLLQGYSFSGLVCLCLIAIILFYTLMPRLGRKFPKFSKAVMRIFTVILCIGLLVVGITEAIVIKASFGNPEETCDYMVVLGAKVRSNGPSVSLQNRINAAYDYLVAHPNTIAVLSGGQGPDEPMTEASCMYDGLVAKGIAPERLWLEDKATSTWENLHFTLDLIEEKTGTRPEKLGVLSSEYHLYRASLFTKACGVEFVGIPARTTILSLKINYFMREVAGVWHYILLGGQYDA